jgi:hypothetical protein
VKAASIIQANRITQLEARIEELEKEVERLTPAFSKWLNKRLVEKSEKHQEKTGGGKMTDRKCSDCENFSPKPEEKLLPVRWVKSPYPLKSKRMVCGKIILLTINYHLRKDIYFVYRHGGYLTDFVLGEFKTNEFNDLETAQTAVEEALGVKS